MKRDTSIEDNRQYDTDGGSAPSALVRYSHGFDEHNFVDSLLLIVMRTEHVRLTAWAVHFSSPSQQIEKKRDGDDNDDVGEDAGAYSPTFHLRGGEEADSFPCIGI